MSIFNPNDWKRNEIIGVADNTLEQLDSRYINTGESVLDQNIDNLNVKNINISSIGKLYFNNDNTEQITAYQPSFVTNQINQFVSNNNLFTGEQRFINLKIVDALAKNSSIFQNGNDFLIQNNEINGRIIFRTLNGANGNFSTCEINQFGNMGITNDFFCNRVRPNMVRIDTTLEIVREGLNYIFRNLNNGGEYHFRTKFLNNNDGWTLAFNPNGQLYGMNNIISHTIETKGIKFRDQITFNLTGSEIFQSGQDIVIENNSLPGNFKLKHKTRDNIQKVLTINEFMNIGGVNDVAMTGTLFLNGMEHKSVGGNYILDNKNNGSGILFNNYDTNGLSRQILFDQFMNASGINDLYCNRLYINNSLINFQNYNTTSTNTQQISYFNSPSPLTRIGNESKHLFIMPNATLGAYNFITISGDTVLSASANSTLTLTSSGSTRKSGFRINHAETEAYNLKIVDGGLKFLDNTIQTTAMTESYLTTLIQNIITQNATLGIPPGTILAYGGDATQNPPNGYYWCFGGLTTIEGSQNLFNVIGHRFSNGQIIYAGSFYLPDLRGAYLKGTGTGTIWGDKSIPMNSVGQKQDCNIGDHSHTYVDRGIGSYTIVKQNPTPGTGTTTTLANDTNGSYWTSGFSYDSITRTQLDKETRPNSIGINYIIKF